MFGTNLENNATAGGAAWSYPKRSYVSAAEDQAAVDRVLAGDLSAFEELVRRWQNPLVNLAYRFCRDRSRAEDMTQEAFLRAYRSLGKWRKESAFSTWLFALATNLYCSELRRIPARSVPLAEAREPIDLRAIDGGFDDGQRERAVRVAVAGLPAKYRETVTLFYFHELDIAATAESLAIPEGTVKARLNRGRAILRRKLAKWFSGELRQAGGDDASG
jgi:RNA polymerase sigma-70 factor, ECF subfamily